MRDAAVDAAAERMIPKHYARDAEIMAQLDKVKWVPGPKGSVALSRIKARDTAPDSINGDVLTIEIFQSLFGIFDFIALVPSRFLRILGERL